MMNPKSQVINAVTFCQVSKALCSHVEAVGQQWCTAETGAVDENPTIEMEGAVPFWIDSGGVANDITLDGMMILTGPNTAGKSTVMRTVCGVALLANCGFMVPASKAYVPFMDGFFFRAASFDAPAERMSAFAVECTEVSTITRDATNRTLVLTDEVARGTETSAGCCLAGAVLESLIQKQCRGIFTTHMHEIFDPPLGEALNLRGAVFMQLETKPAPGEIPAFRTTYRLVPGRCTNSRSIDAAAAYGMDSAVISRARELEGVYRDHKSVLGAYEEEMSNGKPRHAGAARAGGGRGDVPPPLEGDDDYSGDDGSSGSGQDAEARRQGFDIGEIRLSVASLLGSCIRQYGGGAGEVQSLDHGWSPPPGLGDQSCVYGEIPYRHS